MRALLRLGLHGQLLVPIAGCDISRVKLRLLSTAMVPLRSMAFSDFEYKSGVLGQGCYIRSYATRPGLYHCKLPALTVLSLMDLGKWQKLSIDGDIFRDDAMSSHRWRVDNLLDTINEEQNRIEQDGGRPEMLSPLATLIECYWRAELEAIEQAIVRLQADPADLFKLRLSRVLAQLPVPQPLSPE